MQANFNKFLADCNLRYKTEYFPLLCEEQEKGQTSLEEKFATDDGYTVLGKIIGFNVGFGIKSSNYISLEHLEAYHHWLFENYDIKPKQ